MTFEPYPPASAIGGDHAFFDTVAQMQSAVLANGDQCHTAGYLAVGDGGGVDGYTYHSTGQSGETEDGGFVIFGGGADDWFEANNKTVASASQFGADVTGGTDNTAILQACIDSGAIVEITGSIQVTSSLSITVDGTVIRGTGDAKIIEVGTINRTFLINAADDCVIENLTCVGSLNSGTYTPAASADDDDTFIRVQGERCRIADISGSGKPVLVGLSTAHECVVERCRFVGMFPTTPGFSVSSHTAIYDKTSNNTTIRDCFAQDCGSCVLAGSSPEHMSIDGCYATNTWDNGFYLSSANHATVSNSHSTTTTGSGIKARGNGNNIVNCTVEASVLAGIVLSGRSVGNGIGGSVTGCFIDGGTNGISLDVNNGNGCERCVVNGNTVINHTSYGIFSLGSIDCVISNNSIIDDGVSNTNAGIILFGTPNERNVVIGNNVTGETSDDRRSIRVDNGLACRIVDNHMENGVLNINTSRGNNYFRGSIEQIVTLTGTTTNTALGVFLSAGVVLRGARFLVTELVVDDAGDNTWSAAFISGSTTVLATAAAAAADTTVDTLLVPEKTAVGTEVQFTPNLGSFTAGKIHVRVEYEWAG